MQLAHSSRHGFKTDDERRPALLGQRELGYVLRLSELNDNFALAVRRGPARTVPQVPVRLDAEKLARKFHILGGDESAAHGLNLLVTRPRAAQRLRCPEVVQEPLLVRLARLGVMSPRLRRVDRAVVANRATDPALRLVGE